MRPDQLCGEYVGIVIVAVVVVIVVVVVASFSSATVVVVETAFASLEENACLTGMMHPPYMLNPAYGRH